MLEYADAVAPHKKKKICISSYKRKYVHALRPVRHGLAIAVIVLRATILMERVHRLEVVAEDSGAPQPPIGKGDGDHEKQHGANGNADEHPQAQTQAPNSTAAAPKYTIV
jgi:hypothetical protein